MGIDAENLIYSVFAKKPLWDKTTKLYHNRLEVEKLWKEVATELGGDVSVECVNVLKKKWKNLRNSFGKELRKVPEGRSGDEGPLNFETHTSWPHFGSMLFLKNQMRPRKSGGNLSAGGGENDDDGGGNDDDGGGYDDGVQVEQQEDVGQDSVAGSVPDADHSGVDSVAEILPPSNPSNRRPTKRSAQLQLIDIEARKLKLLESKATRKSNTDDDEDAAFFKSLLPHVRKLKPEEKMEFRMDVQGLVQKYVYKKNKSVGNPFQVSNTPLLENSNRSNVQHTPLLGNRNAPLPGFTPLPSSHQSTPTARTLAEINNNNLMEVENEYSTVISTQRRYYSVITSPISSVTSQK